MTATYNPADLATSPKDQVRFFVGDTNSSSFMLQDEEIDWALANRGNPYGATNMCAEALAARFSRLTSISTDGVSQQLSQKAAAYHAVAEEYRIKEVIRYGLPTVGGISKSDMRAVLDNSDRVPDIFKLGMNDDPISDGVDPEHQGPSGPYPWG